MLQSILYAFLMWMAVGLAVAQLVLDYRARRGNYLPLAPAAVFVMALLWPLTVYAIFKQ